MNPVFEQALAGLNPRQREAVALTQGPVLVIAGAGSGKTRMLTVRIAWLIEREQVPPSAILALTFTNKAAREMRERVQQLIPGAGDEVTLSTFHAFCCSLLRRWSTAAGYPEGFTIYDEDDSEKVMKGVLDNLDLDPKKYAPRKMLNLISQLKNELVEPEAFQATLPDDEKLREVYRRYQDRLRENKALDFDDLLLVTHRLLSTQPELLAKFHRRYRYFLVDEYQDTNHAQYRLLHLFARDSGNLCVVGDEDQSIYSWRGATIRNIQEFEKDFPGTRVVLLDQNYRSTQRILDAAGALIARNRRAHAKHLWTDRAGGEPLTFHLAADEREEAEWVAGRIARLRDQGLPLRSFAVLFRMNSLSRSFEQALNRYGLPYEVTGGIRFFQRREVKDILAYLRVIANPWDSVSLARIINTPRRGIGKTMLDKLGQDGPLWEGLQKQAAASPHGKVAEFYELVRGWQELAGRASVFSLVRSVLDRTGYLDWLQEDDPDTAKERQENIDSLVSDIRAQEENNPDLGLRGYLEQAALQADIDGLDEQADRVHLMTLHNAKGLEFPVVFMVAMEEGIFPHFSSHADPTELEEERRLAYVGMTRAMQRLYLSAARRRMVFGSWKDNLVSRFITELPRETFGEPAPWGAALSSSMATSKGGTSFPWSTRGPGGGGPGSQPADPAVPRGLANPGFFDQTAGRKGGGSTRTPRLNAGSGSPIAGGPGTGEGSGPGSAASSAATMLNAVPGAEVFHQVFGHGRVLATEGASLGDFRLTIEFKNVGKKTLLLQYANLRVIHTNSSGG
ncbi:MAG: ATP-dependent DNA helicase UvrD/PcrA [Candidatus Ozemobacter sibiricus]|uniref:DNA 3'-5' helicase n=1 Tax=Candidatus Ozemobacter sibiricus TaxID=2268124 RepID=A0A367ZNM9_9BACT|nr:MAG: ATP-dependent DNA helicase UvrD/PcrA [Candidatus Ozemobacter sibiricus]